MGFLFTTFYQPTANALFLLMDILGTNSITLGIAALVVFTKIILLPWAVQNTRVQIKLNAIAGKLKNIRETVKDKKEQMDKTLELYKKTGVNPFTPILALLIQIPIFISVFFVIKGIGDMTMPYETVFYDFVQRPETLDFQFIAMSITDNGGLTLALLVGVSQFFVMYFSQKNIATEAVKTMQKTLFLVVIPLLVTVFSAFMVAAVGVYWFFNNMVSILQEVIVTKRVREKTLKESRLKEENRLKEAESPQG